MKNFHIMIFFFQKTSKLGFFFPESGKFVTFKTETIIKIMFFAKNSPNFQLLFDRLT